MILGLVSFVLVILFGINTACRLRKIYQETNNKFVYMNYVGMIITVIIVLLGLIVYLRRGY